METVGQRLRSARKASGLTLQALANRIGSSRTVISKVELGANTPTLEWLYKVACALKIPPCLLDPRLTTGSPQPPTPFPEIP